MISAKCGRRDFFAAKQIFSGLWISIGRCKSATLSAGTHAYSLSIFCTDQVVRVAVASCRLLILTSQGAKGALKRVPIGFLTFGSRATSSLLAGLLGPYGFSTNTPMQERWPSG
jgi:hypothetical protein